MTGRRALILTVAGLTVALVVRSTVLPSGWHFVYNVAMAAGVCGLALAAGLGADQFGCSPSRVGAGLRLGAITFAAITFAAITAVIAAGAALGLVDGLDEPGSAGAMLWRVLVLIPVGTVLVEEMIFRGALHGLLNEVTDPVRAWIAGAVLFGLWHVPPIAGDGAWPVVGTLAATTAAGAGFVWLRRRSDSVVAPMLAHVATNSVAYAAAWLLA